MISEGLLIRKARKKNKKAFAKLYLKHIDSIYRYVYFRVGQDIQLAEDLTHDVFCKAWEKIENVNSEKLNFKAWIFRIAHNRLIDHYRNDKGEKRLFEAIPDEKKTDETVFKKLDNEGLFKALNKLPPLQKDAVIMKYIEGISNKEIAIILKKKEDAVRAIHYRALKKLKTLIKNE